MQVIKFDNGHVICLYHLYEESRGACLEPILTEFSGLECVKDAERVIDIDKSGWREMVSVVKHAQTVVCLLNRDFLVLGQMANALLEIIMEFGGGYAADSGILLPH